MRGFGIGLVALAWTGCAASKAPTTRAATCHQPASTAPPGWAVSEIQAAQAYVREHAYTSLRVPLETLGREFADEFADDPEDVELNARIQAAVRFNTVFPRAVGLRPVYEGRRDYWAVIFPLTGDYLKKHPQSSGQGRE